MKKLCVNLACIILFNVAARAADFDLGTNGTLSVTVPDWWSATSKIMAKPDGTPLACNLTFEPRGRENARCILTIFCTTNGAPDKEAIRKEVLIIGRHFAEDSVEKKANLKDFTLVKGYGAYCVFTDPALVGKDSKPGDYKVMGTGEVQPGDNMKGAVSLFADETDGREWKAMLNMINSLKLKPKTAK